MNHIDTGGLKNAAAGFTEDLLTRICEPATTGAKDFATARERFERDLALRRNGIGQSVGSTDARRQEIQRRKTELTDQIGVAYSGADVSTAQKIEAELEDLSREEYGLQSRIGLMKDVKVRGDRDLFEDMLATYTTRLRTSDEAVAALEELARIAEDQEKLLHDFAQLARERVHGFSTVPGSPADNTMVAAAEAMVGNLDMTGNNAGGPERAKIRLVRGHSAGIDNTPGFKIWTSFRSGAAL
ncbi:hypothetical protein AAFA46_08425 [Oscillospiraceae bacterium WX1]